jgi:hypothetical protein
MNAAELYREMTEVRGQLEQAQDEHGRRIRESAEADRTARVAKSSAYLAASGPVEERKAHVDQTTSDVQYEAKLAEGLAQSALEAIRSRRQVLSALQSISAALREEAHLARYEPQGPS